MTHKVYGAHSPVARRKACCMKVLAIAFWLTAMQAFCLTAMLCAVFFRLLQLPPLPGRNYMYTVDYVDEISVDKLTPEGESCTDSGTLCCAI